MRMEEQLKIAGQIFYPQPLDKGRIVRETLRFLLVLCPQLEAIGYGEIYVY